MKVLLPVRVTGLREGGRDKRKRARIQLAADSISLGKQGHTDKRDIQQKVEGVKEPQRKWPASRKNEPK